MNIELKELIAALTGGCTPKPKVITGQHIVVLDRGFVYVGDVSIDGDWLTIANAKNIRIYGTDDGLGELRNGPTPKTKLDEVGSVIAPLRALIHFIPCKGF